MLRHWIKTLFDSNSLFSDFLSLKIYFNQMIIVKVKWERKKNNTETEIYSIQAIWYQSFLSLNVYFIKKILLDQLKSIWMRQKLFKIEFVWWK